jgi:hypothetical protein
MYYVCEGDGECYVNWYAWNEAVYLVCGGYLRDEPDGSGVSATEVANGGSNAELVLGEKYWIGGEADDVVGRAGVRLHLRVPLD